MSWLDGHKFRGLLVTFGLLLVGFPLLTPIYEGRLLYDALLCSVFIAAFLGVFRQPHHRWLAYVLGIPTLVGNWAGYAVHGEAPIAVVVGFHLSAMLFLAFTLVIILTMVYNEPIVSADGVAGAFCGYLLIGLAFAHLYCVVEVLTPGSFSSVPELNGQRQLFLMNYFSFGALTTGGSGDLTAKSAAARSLAVVETILGQFYLAGLVAELIGKRVGQVFAPPSTPASKSDLA